MKKTLVSIAIAAVLAGCSSQAVSPQPQPQMQAKSVVTSKSLARTPPMQGQHVAQASMPATKADAAKGMPASGCPNGVNDC